MQTTQEKERVEILETQLAQQSNQVLSSTTSLDNSKKNNDSEEISRDSGTNLLLELVPSDMWHTHLKWMLTTHDLQNLGILGAIVNRRDETKPYGVFFEECREAYWLTTRPERAEQLKELLYHYKYDEVKALIEKDPLVLTVKLSYYPSRWAEQRNMHSLGQLSALEYVWRMGDANFIELFGTYQEKLPEESFDRKAAMEVEWIVHRDALAQGFEAYGSSGGWDVFEQIYYSAPQWVLGLEEFIYRYQITPKKIDKVDVLTPDFRASAVLGFVRSFGGLAQCRCLSVALKHPGTAARTALKLPVQHC